MAILILPPHFLHIDLIKRQRPHRRPVPSTLSVCCSLPPSWAPQHILTCHKQKKQSPLHLWQHFVFIFAGLILQNGNSSFYNLGFPVTIKAEDFYLYQLAICKCFCLLVCFINCRSISFTHFSIHLCFCPFFTNLTPLFSRFQHLPPWTKTSSTSVSQNSWKSVIQCVSSHKSQSIVRIPWVSISDTTVTAATSKSLPHVSTQRSLCLIPVGSSQKLTQGILLKGVS